MSARQTVLVSCWILTLTLLAWAAAPERADPAGAWSWTTFVSSLGSGGAERRLSAPEGGYARPGPERGPRPYGPRPATEPDGRPRPLAEGPEPRPAYVDLGRR